MREQTPNVDECEQTKRQQIADLILTNTEDFRAETSKIYRDFTTDERLIIDNLSGNGIDGAKVLNLWQEELLPLIQTLQNKPADKSFRGTIAKNLFLDDDEAEGIINSLAAKRRGELLNDFAFKLYPKKIGIHKDVYKKQRQTTVALLTKPQAEIEQIKNHMANFNLYASLADEYHITILDPHSSKSAQRRAKKQIKRECKKSIAIENERLQYISSRLNSLSAMNGGIIIDLFDKKWDLITILSLRNQYEKLVKKLPKEEGGNAVKRLELFDKVTADFKSEQIAELTVDSDEINLIAARAITKNIDTLLLRIFDLTNIQKNQLILDQKEYRELTKERDGIIQLQKSRQKHV